MPEAWFWGGSAWTGWRGARSELGRSVGACRPTDRAFWPKLTGTSCESSRRPGEMNMERAAPRIGVGALVLLALLWRHWPSSIPGLASGGRYMECGDGVALCGVLALQTGLGKGVYRSSTPLLHGLWPQTQGYGSSMCMRPRSRAPPDHVYDCYQQPGRPTKDLLRFQAHEFDKHGSCAGVSDAHEYFTRACNLAAAPLAVIGRARTAGDSLGLQGVEAALLIGGYPVWQVNHGTAEVLLSACAGTDGAWRLARPDHFRSLCGSSSRAGESANDWQSKSSPGAGLVRSVGGRGECVRGRHGPPCSSHSNCAGLPNCLRCARSGFCTDVPG